MSLVTTICGMHPFSCTRSIATVTDWTPPVIASSLVQLPSHAVGPSKAVAEPVPGHMSECAVAVDGNAHAPVDGSQVHVPQVGADGVVAPS